MIFLKNVHIFGPKVKWFFGGGNLFFYILQCFQAGLDAFRPFLVIFSAYDALIRSEVVWNDKTHWEKSFFGNVWLNFSFLKQKTLKNEQKIVENHVFMNFTLQKKARFFAM